MPSETKIAWTDATWNPVTGCSKVSPGCAHCYAETISLRFKRSVGPWTPANAAENVVLHPDRLNQPLRWRRPRMVFVNSMSDLFHEEIPDEFVARVFAVMAAAPQHTFQVLTKRPERMAELLASPSWRALAGASYFFERGQASAPRPWPLPNVWLGVSIENRRFVGRADVLRETPAAVRFISAEPLLGPLVPMFVSGFGYPYGKDRPPITWSGYQWPDGKPAVGEDAGLGLSGIDWLIAGGESGHGARRLDLAWMRGLRDACSDASVAFFVKQLGGARPGTRLEDLPEDLRIRQFPEAPSHAEERSQEALFS